MSLAVVPQAVTLRTLRLYQHWSSQTMGSTVCWVYLFPGGMIISTDTGFKGNV